MTHCTEDKESLLKLNNGGWTNLYKWVENITNEFCEDQAIEEINFMDNIKIRFYNNLH